MNYESNIYATYQRATDADIATGLAWYPTAFEIATRIAKTIEIGAGVIAAFSPQIAWRLNVELAAECIRKRKFRGHYSANNRKARRIFEGADPRKVLGGNKTKAFYECILSAGETDAVCIDRHAIAVCLGRDATELERHKLSKESGKQKRKYESFVSAYRTVSKRVGLSPSALQAIVWVTWRREKGITD